MPYTIIPGVDENYNFPPEVQQAFLKIVDNNDSFMESAITSGSLNNVLTPGFYPVASTSVTDWPVKVYGTLLVTAPTVGRLIQVYTTAAEKSQQYTRFYVSGAWLAWYRSDGNAIYKGFLNGTTDINDVRKDGIYGIALSGGAVTNPNAPSKATGILEVFELGVAVMQRFSSSGNPTEIYTRRGNADGTGFGEWTKANGSATLSKGLLATTTDLNDVRSEGDYGVVISGGVVVNPNAPSPRSGLLEVKLVGIAVMQRYTTSSNPSEIYTRRGNADGTGFGAWTRIDSAGANPAASSGGGAMVHLELKDRVTVRKGGRIGTNNLGVMALRFDDAPKEFVDIALPELKKRNLPFTRVTTSESIHADPIPAGTFSEMEAYCLDAGGEVWNHGRTHGEATGVAGLTSEIKGALDTLRAAMPKIPIDCFAPPGGSISWDGHMPNDSPSRWDTVAGQLILSNHGLASGYYPDSFYRGLDGILRNGQNHYSVDAYNAATAKALVDRARYWKVGIVFMWHCNNIGQTGKMSKADFISVLDYIQQERDNGRLMVLTKSGLGVADRSSSYRDDALPSHSSTGDYNTGTLIYPQYREILQGSTRELIATVTAPAGSTFTSTVGVSTRTWTTPSTGVITIRHVATIPIGTQSVVVSITGGITSSKDVFLYAV